MGKGLSLFFLRSLAIAANSTRASGVEGGNRDHRHRGAFLLPALSALLP